MSMPYDVIHCSHCDRHWTSTILWGRFDYVLPSGGKLNVDRGYGWCRSCSDLVPFERLPARRWWNQAKHDLANLKSTRRACRRDVAMCLARIALNRCMLLASMGGFRSARLGLSASQAALLRHQQRLIELRPRIAELHRESERISLVEEFYELRREAPKCLRCGSVDVLVIEGNGAPHPDCVGQLSFNRSPKRVAIVMPELLFTPHGTPWSRLTLPDRLRIHTRAAIKLGIGIVLATTAIAWNQGWWSQVEVAPSVGSVMFNRGYQWAARNEVYSRAECDAAPAGFQEGCLAFLYDVTPWADED